MSLFVKTNAEGKMKSLILEAGNKVGSKSCWHHTQELKFLLYENHQSPKYTDCILLVSKSQDEQETQNTSASVQPCAEHDFTFGELRTRPSCIGYAFMKTLDGIECLCAALFLSIGQPACILLL